MPPAHAELEHDGKVVGTLTSVAESLDRRAPVALAYVRRDVEPGTDVTVRWEGGSVAGPGGDAPARDGVTRGVLARPPALVLAAVALASCTAKYHGLPPPPSTIPLPPATTSPDYASVKLHELTGRGTTSTTVPIGPGKATLNGTVSGPDGVEPNAVVHIERLVGAAVGAMDIPTNPDGTWSLPNVLGGRYRVRAWRAPDMAIVQPAVFFLGGTESKSVTLPLSRYDGRSVAASIAPRPAVINQPANLVVRLVVQSVDEHGVVRGTPVAGATMQLSGSGDWRVRSENPALTDFNGQASFQVVCQTTGDQPLGAIVDGQFYDLKKYGQATRPISTG